MALDGLRAGIGVRRQRHGMHRAGLGCGRVHMSAWSLRRAYGQTVSCAVSCTAMACAVHSTVPILVGALVREVLWRRVDGRGGRMCTITYTRPFSPCTLLYTPLFPVRGMSKLAGDLMLL